MTTEQQDEHVLLATPGPVRRALAILARRLKPEVLIASGDAVEDACVATEGGVRVQHCVLDLRARGGKCHEVFTSLPRRAG